MANFVFFVMGRNIFLFSFLSVQPCKKPNLSFFRIPKEKWRYFVYWLCATTIPKPSRASFIYLVVRLVVFLISALLHIDAVSLCSLYLFHTSTFLTIHTTFLSHVLINKRRAHKNRRNDLMIFATGWLNTKVFFYRL